MPAESPWHAFRRPVHPENRAHLAALWSELAPSLRTSTQMLGRQWEGCAATIGAMPRCDFGCTACYLGSDANATPALSVEEIREQLRQIRAEVGRWGNVQITDGEVTLRDPDEVVAILRAAHELELIPMLMTHGDSFRKDPALLERLVAEGGLAEMSLHVDTTQRRRMGRTIDWDETELHSIRSELAEISRDVRRRTRRSLRLAQTVTVTRSNLGGVAEIVRWTLANSDQQFGHSTCSQVVMGSAYGRGKETPHFVPLRDPTDPVGERQLSEFFERFGGLSFRSDGRGLAAARAAGVLAAAPFFWATRAPRWVPRFLCRARAGSTLRTLLELGTGRARLDALAVVSHHFMNRETLSSPEGAERESACVFRVPIDGELVSMCRVNATALRERLYASRRQGAEVARR